MVYQSLYPPVAVPDGNILSSIFSPDKELPTNDIYVDVLDPEKRLNGRETVEWVKKLALGLEQLGLKRGDVVLIFTPNHIFVPIAFLGTVGGGFIFSGANPSYTASEFAQQLRDTCAKVVLVYPPLLPTALEALSLAHLPSTRLFQLSDSPQPTRNNIPDWHAFLPTSSASSFYRWPSLLHGQSATTIATINYSSGTTGPPKGVCISHRSILANIYQALAMSFAHKPYGPTSPERPDDRWLGFLPLFHAYGQLFTILMAVALPRATTFVMKEFRFEEFLRAIDRFKITTLHLVPPIVVLLCKRTDVTKRFDLSSVREAGCGAAPLSRELQREVQARYGFPVRQGWGQTEQTCGSILAPEGLEEGVEGSVGKVMPNCEVMLVDEDGKEVVEVGKPGEILVRGPNVMMGYWRNEKATRETLTPDGWLKTGDVGLADVRGFFWIVDRKKELIKVSGFQVAPAELEAVLLENEHIADAAVVGMTLNEQELPRAYVVLQEAARGHLSPEDVQAWLKTRLSRHKWLTGGVVFVDAVPRLPSGKIQRRMMREWGKRDAEEIMRRQNWAKF